MKIGIDCRLWNETGVGRYTRNLVVELSKIDAKNNYVLFVLSKDYENVKCQMSNVKWRTVKVDIRWHTLKEQLRFPKILNKENLDLVHFPYHSVPVFYSKPFILTVHDLIPYNFPTGKASALLFPLYYIKLLGYKFVISQAARKARRIIAISNATKNEIISHLKVSEDKVPVIYEGADDKISNPKSQISNKLQIINYKLQNIKYFLYVGNAYPHKNLERLIEAFNILISQHPNISLVLVGKEDFFYKRLKKKVKEMSFSDKVIFLENVTDEELSGLYKNALAIIMPSLMEGFGLPALEAMASKCLVLASDIPSLREVCGDVAIYFNPYNPKDIAGKMGEVCFNDLNHFSEKIKSGLERVKLFSWEKMAQETLQAYNSLIVSNKNE